MKRSLQVKAMASEVRLEILRMLKDPSKHFGQQWSADPVVFGVCMSLIAEALDVSQPTASRHLDILKQAGFIDVRRHQKWSYCKLSKRELRDYLGWIQTELDL